MRTFTKLIVLACLLGPTLAHAQAKVAPGSTAANVSPDVKSIRVADKSTVPASTTYYVYDAAGKLVGTYNGGDQVNVHAIISNTKGITLPSGGAATNAVGKIPWIKCRSRSCDVGSTSHFCFSCTIEF